MTKRDYIRFVGVMHEISQGLSALGYTLPQRNDILELVAARIGLAFAEDNPRFDSMRFVEACRRRERETP